MTRAEVTSNIIIAFVKTTKWVKQNEPAAGAKTRVVASYAPRYLQIFEKTLTEIGK
jgi:hypothetical protein